MYGGGTFGRTGGAVPRTGGAYVAGDVTITGIATAERFRGGDGTVALPTYSYVNDPDCGPYRAGANAIYESRAGGIVAAITNTSYVIGAATTFNAQVAFGAGFDLTMGAGGQIFADPGTAALPGYSFVGRADQGIVSNSASVASLIGAGAVHAQWGFGGITLVPTSIAGALTLTGVSAWIDLPEVSSPPAPAANVGRMYCLDAATKVRYQARFPTGVAQTIVTEP